MFPGYHRVPLGTNANANADILSTMCGFSYAATISGLYYKHILMSISDDRK